MKIEKEYRGAQRVATIRKEIEEILSDPESDIFDLRHARKIYLQSGIVNKTLREKIEKKIEESSFEQRKDWNTRVEKSGRQPKRYILCKRCRGVVARYSALKRYNYFNPYYKGPSYGTANYKYCKDCIEEINK